MLKNGARMQVKFFLKSFLMATRLVMASLSQTVGLAAQAHTSCSPSGRGWAADCVCATGCRRGEPVKKRDGNTHTGCFNTSTSAPLAACQRNIVSLLEEGGLCIQFVCLCVCIIDISKDGRRVFTSPQVPRCVASVEAAVLSGVALSVRLKPGALVFTTAPPSGRRRGRNGGPSSQGKVAVASGVLSMTCRCATASDA